MAGAVCIALALVAYKRALMNWRKDCERFECSLVTGVALWGIPLSWVTGFQWESCLILPMHNTNAILSCMAWRPMSAQPSANGH